MARKKSEKLDTDVILVVKGAGEQAEDDHLNLFIRGFWPAIKSLDKDATIAQVTDELEDYKPPPHNQEGSAHKHLTEIRAKLQDPDDKKRKYPDKRIWIKESYWEPEVLPSSALGNLSKEWRMSSFVFANMFQDIFFTRNTKILREWRLGEKNYELRPGSAPGTRIVDYVGNYISYLILFLLVFLPFAMTYVADSEFSGILFVIALALIWALAPAFEISIMTYLQYKENINLKSLPGLPGWVLVALIFLLVSNPLVYILIVFLFLALQIALILSRSILWKYRKYANSDMDIATYYSYEEQTRDGNIKRIGKVDESWLTRFPLSPWLYRYFIFLTLPIAFVGTILVRFLKWTRVLGALGEALDGVVRTALVGYMDDVVNYAMDPAQSHRVRSAIKHDILYFHNRPEVKRIHIIAHSQGTPITFETLFHFLEPEHQKKIYTYVTIGSVLSLYHQARGILDPIYYNRFQVPIREEDRFHKEFKWINFWNFTDPITEFYGLDEYTWFREAPPIDEVFERGRTSPTNIRSHFSLLKNHGEYWSNIEQINRPFAKRVLGEPRPIEWNPEEVSRKDWHHLAVWGLWILITAAAGMVGYWLLTSEILNPLFSYFNHIYKSGLGVFTELFPPAAEPNLLQRISDLAASGEPGNPLKNLGRLISNGSLVILAAWVVLDWLGQFRRAFTVGRK